MSQSDEYEALFANLDGQFRDLQANHKEVLKERDEIQEKLSTCEGERTALRGEVASLTRRLEEAGQAARRMELAAAAAKEERDSFAASADVKQGEIDRLHEELKSRHDRLHEAVQRENKVHAELSSVQAQLRPLELQLARAQEEKELLSRHKGEAEKEVHRLQEALTEARKNAAADKVRRAAL
jgi:chromosome segregation ATPase